MSEFPFDPARVNAVVFDLGGVFIAGGPSEVRAFGARIGLPAEQWDRLRHQIFVEEDLWDRVERAESTLDEFAALLQVRVNALGANISVEEAREFMGSPGDRAHKPLRPEIVEVCTRLRTLMPTALLTNNIAEWREAWRQRMDADALFDLVVDSSDVAMRKPEPGIYKLVEQGLGLPGDQLLFVDDLGVNLKTARQLGWQTLKYVDTAAVLSVLNQVAQGRPPRALA